jgi:hypothetical protein
VDAGFPSGFATTFDWHTRTARGATSFTGRPANAGKPASKSDHNQLQQVRYQLQQLRLKRVRSLRQRAAMSAAPENQPAACGSIKGI